MLDQLTNGAPQRHDAPAPTPTEVITRAEALIPALRERVAETAQLRRLPRATVDEAAATGMFGLLVPRSLGGSGGGAEDFVALLRTLAHGDLSAAWTLGFYTAHAWMAARYPRQALDEVFGGPAMPRVTFVGRPPGRAVPDGDAYVLSGSWGYATGVMDADWVQVPALIEGVDTQTLFLVPRDQVEVLDTWHMTGMRGTGSHHIRIEDARVPVYRTLPLTTFEHRPPAGRSVHPEPVHSYIIGDFFPFIFPSFVVSAAEVILDEYRDRLDSHRAAFSPDLAGDTAGGQLRYARALSALRTARTVLERTVAESVRRNAASPEDKTDEERALMKLDCLAVCRAAREAVDTVVRGSGSAVFRSAGLTVHFLHDMEVALSHVTIDEDGMQVKAARILLNRADEPEPGKMFV